MTPDAQLLVRTWRRDLDWLKVCLQSAQKHWKSSYAPVVVATPDCEGSLPLEIKEMAAAVYYEPQWADQRAGANYIGLSADLYTEAPIVLITDSDCAFRMPVCTDDFLLGGKIIVRGEPWETVKDPVNQICIDMYRVWIKESTGLTATHETMRHHPFVFWREDFQGLRDMIQKTTGVDAKTWIQQWSARNNSGYASEFNLLGTYCLKGDRPYMVLPTLLWDDQKIRQFHSWSQTPVSMWEQIFPLIR